MKKNLKKLAALLLAAVIAVALLPTAAFAASDDYSTDAKIPFEISAHGCGPGANPLERDANLIYSVILAPQPSEPDNPVKENIIVDVKASDLIEEAETGVFFPKGSSRFYYNGNFEITFTKPGIYHYVVSQVRYNDPARVDEYCFYSEEYYNVSVNVVNDDNGGLAATVVIHQPHTEIKPDKCSINNCYGFYLNVEKEWSGIPARIPEVNVAVSHGENEVYNVSLNEMNEWKLMLSVPYDYRDLDKPGLGYSIEEKPVPGGYYAVYADPVNHWSNMEGGANFYATDLMVKNYHVLIQTGQLNWPIPVMLGLGALLICAGVVMLSKKKNNA